MLRFALLPAVLAVALPCAAAFPASQLQEAGPAKRNAVYLPTSIEATQALANGDREALLALQSGAASHGHWIAAFESWRSALSESEPGDSVAVGIQLSAGDNNPSGFEESIRARWPDRDNSFQRRTEAIENAVLRRLCGLDPAERQVWSDHFRPLEEERAAPLFVTRGLTNASRATGLRALEREFPGTRSAFRAALWLFEDALESGEPRSAWVWLERARMHSKLLGEHGDNHALGMRSGALDRMLEFPGERNDSWPRADEFEPLEGHPLTLPNRSKPRSMARIEGQPGMAFLKGGAVLVQTTGTCWLMGGEEEDRIFEPWRLAQELTQPIPRSVNRTGRDWPFYPLAGATEEAATSIYQDIYIISGRADGQASNLLQRIRPPHRTELPVAVWSLGGAGLFLDSGAHVALDTLLAPGMWEFQPGPILVEGTLFVQARCWVTTESNGDVRANAPGEAQSWLLALDAATGVPRWKRMLSRGTDIVSSNTLRLSGAGLIRTPAQPLRATGRMVFVGTNLGASFLLDIADGRLVTSFANDRREDSATGWESTLRPNAWESATESEPVLLWAPADGLELYGLRAGLDFAPRGSDAAGNLLPDPPLVRGESRVLLGGGPREVLVLGKAGARHTVSTHDLRTGARRDSIYLALEEKPIPGALLQSDRLLFATDRGLYRLDRSRELYLEAFQPLRMTSDFAPGGLIAKGQNLYLLAAGALFHFQSR